MQHNLRGQLWFSPSVISESKKYNTQKHNFQPQQQGKEMGLK